MMKRGKTHLNAIRLPPQRRPALAAKVRRDGIPLVGALAHGFRCAGDEGEVGGGREDVGAEGAAGDLAAVVAVAERLHVRVSGLNCAN